MLLNKQNFIPLVAVSKEESRYSIKTFNISGKGTCATDGHQLVRVSLPGAEIKDFPHIDGVRAINGNAAAVTLDADMAKKIQSAVPKSKIPALNHVLVGEPTETAQVFAVTDASAPQIFFVPKHEEQFPNVDAVIPTKEPVFKIVVDAKLLANLAKASAQFTGGAGGVGGGVGGAGGNRVTLSFYGPDRVMKLTSRNEETGQDFLALLMPLRSER